MEKVRDNSDFQDKILLRNRVFDYFEEIPLVIDFYSGDCVIAKKLWANISIKVICIDKKKQIEAIPGNIERMVADNAGKISLSNTCNVIDCDAYGLVMPFISKIIKGSTCDKVIFFTDGTPTRHRRFKSAKKEFYKMIDDINPDEFICNMNMNKSAFYGMIFKKI